MRKNKFVITGFILIIAIICIAIFTKTEEKGKVFNIAGRWPLPPAFNGNPFSPNGDSHAKYFVFGKLAPFEPMTGKHKNYFAQSFREDGDTLTVKLKPGIKWHDGTPFTSQDVKTNFIINSAFTLEYIWSYIDSMETLDNQTIIFNLSHDRTILTRIYILDEQLKAPYHIYKDLIPEAREIRKLVKDKKMKEHEVKHTTDVQKQREYIQKAAWATNEYLPVIDFVQGASQYFLSTDGPVTQWPEQDELVVGLNAEWRTFPIMWALEGKLFDSVK